MLNKIRFIICIFLIGFIFFTCGKNEAEVEPEYDFRDELIGTYIVVCTQEQTFPYNPTLVYPIDTTDIGKEIEVTYDPANELEEDGSGEIIIGGGNMGGIVILSTYDNSYCFSNPWLSHGRPRISLGCFISPDSIYRAWDSTASPSAEYRYECRGSKIQ